MIILDKLYLAAYCLFKNTMVKTFVKEATIVAKYFGSKISTSGIAVLITFIA
jgi:hypothetical protein